MGLVHLTEDDLVLHYYHEAPEAEERAAAAHLDSCGECRTAYTRLQRVLGTVDELAVTPVDLPPSFERTVWTRLEPRLRQERPGWIAWLLMTPAPLGLAAAVVVLVVGAFMTGRGLSTVAPTNPSTPPSTARTGEQIRERIFLEDLGEHLDRSQMVLVELVSGEGDGPVDISGERARAEELIADSRLYRQTAEQTGDTAVSELLDEIERVLTEIAASSAHVSSQDRDVVRRRIESRDLLFKVRVVSSEVRERQKDALRAKTGQRS